MTDKPVRPSRDEIARAIHRTICYQPDSECSPATVDYLAADATLALFDATLHAARQAGDVSQ